MRQKELAWAKKLTVTIIILALSLLYVLSLASCQKENIVDAPKSTTNDLAPKNRVLPEQMLSRIRAIRQLTAKGTYYVAEENNPCYPEYVGITGLQTARTDTFTINGVFYRTTAIKYYQLKGEGHISGLTYRGYRNFSDILKLYPDNSVSDEVSTVAAYGTTQGDSIIIDEHSRFLYSPTGVMTIDYNNIIHRCK